MTLLSTVVCAQKNNLSLLPQKERNEYLVKKAYDAVMKYGPDWYRDYREPEIKSFIIPVDSRDPDREKTEYSIRWYYDPAQEKMIKPYSVAVGIYESTGELRWIMFGDGGIYGFTKLPRGRSAEDLEPYPFRKYEPLPVGVFD